MRRLLPILTAVVFVALIAWSFWVALAGAAELTGSSDVTTWTWAQRVTGSSAMPLPSGTLTVNLDRSVSVMGQPVNGTFDGDRTITIAGRDDFVLMHEIGHAYDQRELDDGERAHLLGALRYPVGTPWENADRWTDGDPFCARTACPNEVFASAYAGCALGYELVYRRGIVVRGHGRAAAWWIGPHPILTRADMRSICRYIDRAGVGA